MAKARRVFEIAKEIGVESKAIVDKCTAEGVPGITNHMSVVKLGLEATIREWFSESHTVTTAVETAEKVDLAKVAGSKARKRKKADGGDVDGGGTATAEATATATPTLEPPRRRMVEPAPAPASPPPPPSGGTSEPAGSAVEESAPLPTPPISHSPAPALSDAATRIGAPAHRATPSHRGTEPLRPAAATSTPAPPISLTPPASPAPLGSAAPATTPVVGAPPVQVAASAPAEGVSPAGRPNVPDRPANVRAGAQLEKPKKAVLQGPRVVRIEKAEVVAPPRTRRPPGPGPGPAAAASGDSEGGSGISRSRGPARGRGAGPAPDADAAARQPAKRRSLSTRRGRSAEALPVGPSKFSEQDLIELDARLNHAQGFLKQRRRELKKTGGPAGSAATSAAVTGGAVQVSEPITIKSLSAATGIKSTEIIKYLFKKNIMATINSAIDATAAIEVALEYDIELNVQEQTTAEQAVIDEFDSRAQTDVRPRPPVVTVLGHVDHGKTSLLDRIRKADVAAHEAGGITQHVGAYRVSVKSPEGKTKTVVFLDTPGHEAFTSMRARGAKMTDLVVLVIAADDGVMPQTIESINHAKAAGVPIIVALNKIDKQEATEGNIRKIYGQIAEQGLNPTEWGGTTEVAKVSATQGTGVTDLLELLDYQAELLALKADYGGKARGTVIESEMQPGRGPVARVLVQQGQLRVGDFIVVGRAYGRVRDMTDEYGKQVTDAGPATPLELSGIDMIPDAGDKFYVTTSLQKAEEIATSYRENERHKQLAQQTKVTLDNFAEQMKAGGAKELRVVLKADVQGSIDVLKKSLSELGNQEVSVKVLHAAVGGVTESDVLLADASDAIIVGFHVIASPAVREIGEARGVDIRLYRIIYEVKDEITKSLEGMLDPEKKEEEIGTAEVREVFHITKVGSIAGCMVTDGTLQRNARMRVVRDGAIVTDNRGVDSLRRLKEDVKEVRAGMECGVKIAGFDDLKPGDKLICYNTITIARKLQ